MGYSIDDAQREMYEDQIHEHIEEQAREHERSQKEYEDYVGKRRRLRLMLLGACVAFSAFGAALSVIFFQKNAVLSESGTFPFLAISIFGVAFGGAALIYLRPTSTRRETPSSTELLSYIDFRIDELLSLNKRSHSGDAEKRDRQIAIDLLRKKLEGEAVKGFLDQIKADAMQAARRDSLDARLQMTRQRLSQEVQDLAKRGNLNLVLGILTTLAGLSTLAYAVVTAPSSISVPDILGHFLPRLSLAFLIEIFAYFFLKLYKQTLTEIKYFQNELTNVESTAAAAMFALESGNAVLFEKIALSLSKTERNFVIHKDQTTVDLERERLASKGSEQAIKTLADLLGGVVRLK